MIKGEFKEFVERVSANVLVYEQSVYNAVYEARRSEDFTTVDSCAKISNLCRLVNVIGEGCNNDEFRLAAHTADQNPFLLSWPKVKEYAENIRASINADKDEQNFEQFVCEVSKNILVDDHQIVDDAVDAVLRRNKSYYNNARINNLYRLVLSMPIHYEMNHFKWAVCVARQNPVVLDKSKIDEYAENINNSISQHSKNCLGSMLAGSLSGALTKMTIDAAGKLI